MSRVGKKPIPIPPGVEVKVEDRQVTVKGPKGTLTQSLHPCLKVEQVDQQIRVECLSEKKAHRALHGLTRSLIANMVMGVSQGFQKTLDLVGVGYRAQQAGDRVILQVGYTHPVEINPLPHTRLVVEGTNRIQVQGIDKQAVGELAARIRRVRPPDPYTGKGVRYANEVVHLKPGKSAAAKGTGRR